MCVVVVVDDAVFVDLFVCCFVFECLHSLFAGFPTT